MPSWNLTNLLATSTMTISGATLSGGVFTYPAGEFCMITHPLPVPTAGHKYYGRVDQKVPAGTTFGDGRFEYYGGDGEGKNIVFASFYAATMDNQWHTYSDILSFPYVTGANWTLRSFSVSGSNTVYRRNHMIIDLTAAFGAGHEPTKDWCDRCIPFFESNKTIETKPLVGVGGVAKPIVGGYVGVGGVAKKIIAGYVGINGVAKQIWKEEKVDPIDWIAGFYRTYENDLVINVERSSLSDFAMLASVSLPNATRIEVQACVRCHLLTDVSLPKVTFIGSGAFTACEALTVLRIGLQSNVVCTLENTSAIPANIQTIYVPASLANAYREAENWSTFADKIVGI